MYIEMRAPLSKIVIPFADESKRQFRLQLNEKAVKTKGTSIMRDIERNIALARLDTDWKNILETWMN